MPTLPKKIFYIRLLFGAGAIVGGLAVLALQFFVLHRVNIFLSLGCAAAILGGLASPLFLRDWACATCGSSLSNQSIKLPPPVAGTFLPALAQRNVGQMAGVLSASAPTAEGLEVDYQVCDCGKSLMISGDSAKEVVFLDQDAAILTPQLARLVVESD